MPFSRLLTYRTLDGTISDFPVEESICLLKRAAWVQDQLKVSELQCSAVLQLLSMEFHSAAAHTHHGQAHASMTVLICMHQLHVSAHVA